MVVIKSMEVNEFTQRLCEGEEKRQSKAETQLTTSIESTEWTRSQQSRQPFWVDQL